jgi:hypothetical protein
MANLLSPVFWAASFFVPKVGWAIYGGLGCFLKMQVLSSIEGNWTAGPDLYQGESRIGQCGAQVTALTFFL